MKKSYLYFGVFVLLAVSGGLYVTAYISPHKPITNNFDELLERADQGNVEAQYSIAKAYRFGRGVEKSDLKALEYYKKAADQGLAKAQNSVGAFYELGTHVDKNTDIAIEWYKKAANQGYVMSQFNLAVIEYRNERYEQAFPWFQKAAESKHPDAQNYLGVMYANGQGVSKDQKKSIFWHKNAAKNGSIESQYNLGYHYYENKQYEQAFPLIKKASDKEISKAQHTLAKMHEFGLGVTKDLLHAGTLYKNAADQGVIVTQGYLQDTLSYCTELKMPSEKQIEACFITAGAKYPEAQEQLATFYTKGYGVPKSSVEAHAWTFTFLSFYKDQDDIKQKTIRAMLSLSSFDKLSDVEKEKTKEKSMEYMQKYSINAK